MAGRGSSKGTDNLMWIAVGSMTAVVADYVWNSVHLPGWNTIVGGVSKKGGKTAPVTAADWIQMFGTGALGLYGNTEGSATKIPAFTFGAFMTQLITKFGFPSFGLARYILFDIDASGRLVPTRQFQ